MKIVHLLATPFFSGPSELVVQLALGQRDEGHQVWVVCDRLRQKTSAEELLLPHLERERLLAPVSVELSVKSAPLGLMRDVRQLRRTQVEVVHCHLSHDHWLGWLGRPPGALLVRSFHTPRSLRGLRPPAEAATAYSSGALTTLDMSLSVVLRPAVDPAFAPPHERKRLQAELGFEGPVLGMVSTFQPSRRHSLGLEAFARLARKSLTAQFVLLGDGQLEPALRRQVEALGLANRVRFAGYQGGDAFRRWLQSLDEVWVLGLGNDFSARAAAQARACGARVLAVDEGALGEYADVTVAARIEDIVENALAPGRRSLEVARRAQVAREVLALYERAFRSA